MPRPDVSEYAGYYERYVSLVPETDIMATLQSELAKTVEFLHAVPDAEAGRHHLTYTWTFRQVLGHMLDAERIFGYRALRFARNDTTPLSGFEENDYVVAGDFDKFALRDLTDEFALIRRSHIYMFRHLTPEAWDRSGKANNNHLSVRALAYILVGHERHHMTILRKRLASVSA